MSEPTLVGFVVTWEGGRSTRFRTFDKAYDYALSHDGPFRIDVVLHDAELGQNTFHPCAARWSAGPQA